MYKFTEYMAFEDLNKDDERSRRLGVFSQKFHSLFKFSFDEYLRKSKNKVKMISSS